MERILIIGAGKMGAWLAETLCTDFEVGVFDNQPERLKYLFNTHRFNKLEDISDFEPELMINAVGLKETQNVFEQLIPLLP